MASSDTDKSFTGSIPQLYEQYLVPLIFQRYAGDLAERVAARGPRRVLELAAGTGVVTRALTARLPADVAIVATDLNQAMIDHAATIGTGRPVEWRQADAQRLPFEDASFDVVVCQFGMMFMPDKPAAFSEVRRVLRPGGALLFNVWDRLADNEFAQIVEDAASRVFPADPPGFLGRTPYNYNDVKTIGGHIAAGGFTRTPAFVTLPGRSVAPAPSAPAIGFAQGTPLRLEIEKRDPVRLEEVTRVATDAIRAAFGEGTVDARMQAIVVQVEK